MAVKTDQAANIRKKQSLKRKKPCDFLEELKKLVTDTDDEDEVESHQMQHASRSAALNSSIEEEAKKMVSEMFNCSICLNPAKLPAAACACCFAVIGCIPCVEQWYETHNGANAKCPLCRTNKEYNIVPILRKVALILQQPLPEVDQVITIHSDNDSLDTIPYVTNEMPEVGDDDDELPVALLE